MWIRRIFTEKTTNVVIISYRLEGTRRRIRARIIKVKILNQVQDDMQVFNDNPFMYDLISIGTVSIDFYYQSSTFTQDKDRFELAVGGKYFAEHFYEGLGGGATNVAIGVHNDDLRVALMAKVGTQAFKKFILDKLDASGLTYKPFSQFDEEYLNVSSILLTESGERTIINYRSPHQHFITNEEDFAHFIKSRAIYLANLASVPLTERFKMLRYAKKYGIITFVNLGVTDCRRPKSQLKDFLEKIDVLIVNGHEFADLVKAPYKDLDFSEDVVAHYMPTLRDQVVVVTDGEKGSNAYFNGELFFQPAAKVSKVLDTTGAGDGYTAGFISEYLKTNDIRKAMKNGAKYAAKIIEKIGAN